MPMIELSPSQTVSYEPRFLFLCIFMNQILYYIKTELLQAVPLYAILKPNCCRLFLSSTSTKTVFCSKHFPLETKRGS